MLAERYPCYLANRAASPNSDLVVTNKHTGEAVTRVPLIDAEGVRAAIGTATMAFSEMRLLPAFARQKVLAHVAAQIGARSEEFAKILAIEAGKPIRDARGEVARAVDTFRAAAEEAVRITGERLPLDISPRAAGYEGVWRRVPIGPCAFITPFNFPLNLVAHKVAPALAVGCPFVLKPASATPVSALLLGAILAEAELPAGAFSILPCRSEHAEPLVTDERIKMLSFTGSPAVGWDLKSRAGRKRVTLELGGNAACIVDRDADLDYAAERITIGAFYQSGQSCIKAQRIIAHRDVYEPLKQRLIERAAKLKSGDPLAEDTFLGPLITEDDARRIETWVSEAVAAGARTLCGGRRDGRFYAATWLEGVPPDQKVSCAEVFGPVATLQPFDAFEEALAVANASDFGLQCGVFTNSLTHTLRAFDELDVGGVIINDSPAFRVDNMPYGGVKQSGFGREGIRFAMEEMSEIKLLVINRRANAKHV